MLIWKYRDDNGEWQNIATITETELPDGTRKLWLYSANSDIPVFVALKEEFANRIIEWNTDMGRPEWKARYHNEYWVIDQVYADGSIIQNAITLGPISEKAAMMVAYELNKAFQMGVAYQKSRPTIEIRQD